METINPAAAISHDGVAWMEDLSVRNHVGQSLRFRLKAGDNRLRFGRDDVDELLAQLCKLIGQFRGGFVQ